MTITLTLAPLPAEIETPAGFANAHRYLATLHHGCREMTIPFFTGSGWTHDPEVRDVLENLTSAAVDLDETFEDWCANYGEDEDSRRAERVYESYKTQTAELRELLGETLFEQLTTTNDDRWPTSLVAARIKR